MKKLLVSILFICLTVCLIFSSSVQDFTGQGNDNLTYFIPGGSATTFTNEARGCDVPDGTGDNGANWVTDIEFYAGEEVISLNGVNQLLRYADSDCWTIGIKDFSLDGYIYREVTLGATIFSHGNNNDSTMVVFSTIFVSGTDIMRLYVREGGNTLLDIRSANSGELSKMRKNHYKLARQNGVIKFFVNGQSIDLNLVTGNMNADFPNCTEDLILGGRYSASAYWEHFEGYLSPSRLTVGKARNFENFVTPNRPHG